VKGAVLAALRFYKRNISPQLPPACRYTPTCSEYAMEAIERRGVIVGGLLATKRVLSCNPFSRGGYDPVPEAHAR
jgi:putative membrane protein insertion efficiency factor